MALYKRCEVWHYDFAIDGNRYRGSTKEKAESKARMIEAKLMMEGSSESELFSAERYHLLSSQNDSLSGSTKGTSQQKQRNTTVLDGGCFLNHLSPAYDLHTLQPMMLKLSDLSIRLRMRIGRFARCGGCWAKLRSGA